MYNKKKQSMWTYIHQNSAIYATNPDCDSDSHSALVYNKKSQIPRYPQKGLIHPEDVYIHKKAPNIGPRKKKPYMSAKEPSTSTKEPHISIKEPYIYVQRIHRILISNESHKHIHKNATHIYQRALSICGESNLDTHVERAISIFERAIHIDKRALYICAETDLDSHVERAIYIHNRAIHIDERARYICTENDWDTHAERAIYIYKIAIQID